MLLAKLLCLGLGLLSAVAEIEIVSTAYSNWEVLMNKSESFSASYPNYCSAARDETGLCVPDTSCPSIISIFELKKEEEWTAEDRFTLENSLCKTDKVSSDDDEAFVCCPEEVNEYGLKQLKQKPNCGKFEEPGKSKGSYLIQEHSRPWMALLVSKVNEMINPFCGGTLITKHFVMTAAHCIPEKNSTSDPLRSTKVILGEHDWKVNETCYGQPCELIMDVEKFIVHPRYNHNTKKGDIALVKLARRVDWNDHIRPICLPLNENIQREANNENLIKVTGWGETEHARFSNVPREVVINRMERDSCTRKYSNVSPLDETQICAGASISDSCSGDSGGPLFGFVPYFGAQRFVQIGIVSAGGDCKQNNALKGAIYTTVTTYIPWISREIAKNSVRK